MVGGVSLVKSKWECIIWALHRIDPEHSPLFWAFLPAQIEGLPQEEVLWLGTIGIYPLLICGIEKANPWQKADTESEGRWMMPGWRGCGRGKDPSIENSQGLPLPEICWHTVKKDKSRLGQRSHVREGDRVSYEVHVKKFLYSCHCGSM